MNSIEIKQLDQKKKFFKKSASFSKYGGIALITIGIIFLIITIYFLYQFNNFHRDMANEKKLYFTIPANEKVKNSPEIKEFAAINQMLFHIFSFNIFLKLYFFIINSFLFIVIGIILRQISFSFQTLEKILEEIELTI